jgi:tRNA-modifying protein YgfZ
VSSDLVVCLPELATLSVTGSERLAWLQGLLTCDVKAMHSGRGGYGLILSRSGTILTDTTVLATEDVVLLSAAAGRGDAVRAHLERLLVMEDAELVDRSSDLAWILVVGDPDIAQAHAVAAGRVSWPGFVGTALVVPRPEITRVASAIGQPITPGEWEAARITLGFPRFGLDYDERHTPHEASLEHGAICWTKGCYVGQDVVSRQEAAGPSPRRLVRLEVAAPDPPPPGTPVLADGSAVGEVTSSMHVVPDGVVAMARVISSHAGPGQALALLGSVAIVAEVPQAPATC